MGRVARGDLGAMNMIKVIITDSYADCGPNREYENYRGVGMHRTSVKKAIKLAKADLSRNIRQGGEWAACGTPIAWQMVIERNGVTMIRHDDGIWYKPRPTIKVKPGTMKWTSPRLLAIKKKWAERRAA